MDLENELNLMNNEIIPENILTQVNTVQDVPQEPVVAPATPVVQPAMVNPATSQEQVQGFSIANLEFDINKDNGDLKSPLERLEGKSGESFRLHILPVNPLKVHIHTNDADPSKVFNFVCLKDAYNMQNQAPCCITYGDPKTRNIIPVLVYPTQPGNPNAVIPNVTPELKVLIINYKKLEEIKNAASAALGVPIKEVDLNKVDILATVDNPTFKSHTFNCTGIVLIEQVKPYLDGILNKWKELATPENVCKSAGKLITLEDYNANYANYVKREPQAQVVPQATQYVQQPYQQQGFSNFIDNSLPGSWQ